MRMKFDYKSTYNGGLNLFLSYFQGEVEREVVFHLPKENLKRKALLEVFARMIDATNKDMEELGL